MATLLRWPWALAFVACSAPTPEAAPLEGWLAHGCTTVRAPAICEARAGDELRVWLPARAADRIDVRVGGESIAVQRLAVGPGELVRWTAPSAPGPVVLSVRSSSTTRALSFTLALVETSTPSEPRRRDAARHYGSALGALRGGRDDAALAELERALPLAQGDPQRTARIVATAVYVLAVRQDDPVGAERWLAALEPTAPLDTEGAALAEYAAGQVAWRLGDWRGADRAFGAAEGLAARIAIGLRAIAAQGRAMALVEAGQLASARPIIAGALADETVDRPCWRADLLVSAGWIELREARDLDGAQGYLERAIALYDGACGDAAGGNNARLDLALIEERRGRWEAARAALAIVRGPELPYASTWREALEGRAALAAGAYADAARTFARLVRRSTDADMEVGRWQGLVGLGRVAEAQGALERAAGHYALAEQSVDLQLRRAPIERGQLSFVEDRSDSADGLVRVRVRQGRLREALEAARRARRRSLLAVSGAQAADRLDRDARVRYLRQLTRYHHARAALAEARAAAWETYVGDARLDAHIAGLAERATRELDAALALLEGARAAADDDLRAPEPGEMLLLARPMDGVHRAFVASATEVRTATLAGPEASEWLRAFAPQLAAAHTVTALATADPRWLDLHVATIDGAALAVSKNLRYAVDLPPRAATSTGRRALVVADARGDLPHARGEAHAVIAELESKTWSVRALVGSDAARPAVLDALGDVDLLHYAGHGWYAGAEGWQSGLALSDGELSVGDIVTSSVVPTWVVLSACEGASAGAATRGVGLGIAQAFLVAGAAQVIAADPRVDDVIAGGFARDLHRLWRSEDDLAIAYRRAAESGVAWRRFRLIVR